MAIEGDIINSFISSMHVHVIKHYIFLAFKIVVILLYLLCETFFCFTKLHWVFFKRKNDDEQQKPKGSCRVDSLADIQESRQNWYLEHQSNVRSQGNSTRGEWDEALQHLSLRTERDEVAVTGTDKTKHWRNAVVFWTYWGGSPSHRTRRTDVIPGGTKSFYWSGTC